MPISTTIKDGHGTDNLVQVTPQGAIPVVLAARPPVSDEVFTQPFRQYMTVDGAPSSSNDMTVDGSSTNVDFFVPASSTQDIYIKSISIVIGDGGSPALNKYGALTALSNGVRWDIFTQEDGLNELHDGIKTNLEFIRIGLATAAIGTGTDAFLADVSGGGTEKSYLPVINMAQTFGLPFGVRLRRGTTDKLIFTVRDDLSALTTHNAICYGIRL